MVNYAQNPRIRALVADDDPIVRRMVSFALSQEGIDCESANDGEHAFQLLGENSYDLLVTDLRMPKKNGHALSMDILGRESRPAIIVHTSVEEPKLTKDLIIRGVDDVIYKPANYKAFAAKARALVERRREQNNRSNSAKDASGQPKEAHVAIAGHSPKRVPAHDVQRRLADLESIFPLSHVAFDVYSLATRQDVDADELVEAIEQDASLTAEVLKCANCTLYSPGSSETDSVEKAIVRLGRRHLGELALAVGGRQALAVASIPWIDRDRLWKRSLAAGIGLRVIESPQTASRGSSAFLSALLHPIGRIVLATLFSDQHRELFERCRTTGESLDAAEKATFGLSYGEAGACLLSAWRIPAEARLPLEYITRMFNELTPLSEPVRHCVETVKLSILLARIAVCCWEAWDVVDLPRASTLKRLCTESVAVTLSKIRERCETSVASHSHRPAILQEHGTPPANSEVLYLSPIEDSQDLLRSLVSSLGLTVRDSLETSAANSQRVLINGVLTSGIQLSNFIKTCKSQDLLGIIRKNEDASLFDPNATICLPTTVRNLLEFFAI